MSENLGQRVLQEVALHFRRYPGSWTRTRGNLVDRLADDRDAAITPNVYCRGVMNSPCTLRGTTVDTVCWARRLLSSTSYHGLHNSPKSIFDANERFRSVDDAIEFVEVPFRKAA